MRDSELDQLVQRALADSRPTEEDADFAVRLLHRIRVEEALRPRREAPSGVRWRWALGFASSAAVIAGAFAMIWRPTSETAVVPAPSPRERIAALVEEHRGAPMVVRINEERGSYLFVAAPGRRAGAVATDRLDLMAPGSVTVIQPTAGQESGGSGWLRVTRDSCT